jgi:hypothetical protein
MAAGHRGYHRSGPVRRSGSAGPAPPAMPTAALRLPYGCQHGKIPVIVPVRRSAEGTQRIDANQDAHPEISR